MESESELEWELGAVSKLEPASAHRRSGHNKYRTFFSEKFDKARARPSKQSVLDNCVIGTRGQANFHGGGSTG